MSINCKPLIGGKTSNPQGLTASTSCCNPTKRNIFMSIKMENWCLINSQNIMNSCMGKHVGSPVDVGAPYLAKGFVELQLFTKLSGSLNGTQAF